MIGYSELLEYIKSTKVAFIVTNNYVYALVLFLAFFILAYIAVFIIRKYISFLTRKTKTRLDDDIIDATRGPVFYLLIAFGLLLAVNELNFSEKIAFHVVNVVQAVIYFGFTIVAARIISIMIDFWGKKWAKRTKATLDDELLPLFNKTSSVLVYIVAFLLILRLWNIDITGLLAGLGIAGLAIGFAVKDSLANLFGGISMILDKNVKVGDKIKLENGVAGIVKDIGLRSTRIRTFDNELIIVPNGTMANSQIQNFVLPDQKARININFGVEYGSDIKKVQDVVLKAIKKLEHVMKDPAVSVDFTEMSDFALNFACRIWVEHYSHAYSTKLKATEVIYNALNEAKIGIPFPTQTVFVDKIRI
jgi:MscS family membrane protein